MIDNKVIRTGRKRHSHTPSKMNWKALQDGNCPSCGNVLHYNEDTCIHHCGCNFRISVERFREITSGVASGVRRPGRYRLSEEEVNQQKLSDL